MQPLQVRCVLLFTFYVDRGAPACVFMGGGGLSEEQRPSLSMMFRNVCNCWLLLSATLPSVSFGTCGKLEQSGASVQTNWV